MSGPFLFFYSKWIISPFLFKTKIRTVMIWFAIFTAPLMKGE